jgi:hypothetical protein
MLKNNGFGKGNNIFARFAMNKKRRCRIALLFSNAFVCFVQTYKSACRRKVLEISS